MAVLTVTLGLTCCCTDFEQISVAPQQLTALTQSSLPTGIHLLSHLQSLCGGYVHIGWNNHQANGLLFSDELLNEILDLKLFRVQQLHIVKKKKKKRSHSCLLGATL